MLTAKTITDEQISELFVAALISDDLHFRALTLRTNKARACCAAILNARKETK